MKILLLVCVALTVGCGAPRRIVATVEAQRAGALVLVEAGVKVQLVREGQAAAHEWLIQRRDELQAIKTGKLALAGVADGVSPRDGLHLLRSGVRSLLEALGRDAPPGLVQALDVVAALTPDTAVVSVPGLEAYEGELTDTDYQDWYRGMVIKYNLEVVK